MTKKNIPINKDDLDQVAGGVSSEGQVSALVEAFEKSPEKYKKMESQIKAFLEERAARDAARPRKTKGGR